MDINSLRSDELTWELSVRGVEIGSTVDQKRMQLRSAIRSGILFISDLGLDPAVELSICSAKLDELIGNIQEFDNRNRSNEFKRISSRLLHLQGRVENIVGVPEYRTKKENLIFLLNGAFEALNDAYHIASLVQSGCSHLPGTSSLDQPSQVGNLIDFDDRENVVTESGGLERDGNTGGHSNNSYRVDQRTSQDRNAEVCAQLSRQLNRLALQPYSSARDNSRRVSFASESIGGTGTQPLIESVRPNSNHFQNLNSTPLDMLGSSAQNSGRASFVSVYKLGVYFDGSGSVISFLEEIEQLSESRGITKAQLFHSIYELLKGDARDWFLPRKYGFLDWEDFKKKLKDAFMPLQYEENLLEDIKRRTQGADERVMLYIIRMQNLFRKLSIRCPPEAEQVQIIRRNLLPHLQTTLSFQETNTIEELLSKCRDAEQVQWQAQQYCPPPTQARLVQEQHLCYRRPISNKVIPVRALEKEEPTDLHLTRNAMDDLEKSPRKCFNCGQPGHLRAKCPQPRKLSCFKCGLDGYTSRNCIKCTKNENQGC